MLKVLTGTAIIGLAVVLGCITTASAQIPEGSAVRFNVAEAFVIDNKTFPAGEYTIRRADVANTPSMLEISGNHESMIFDTLRTDSSSPVTGSGLVFEKVGDEMFLTRILLSGDDEGYQLLLPRSEKTAIAGATP